MCLYWLLALFCSPSEADTQSIDVVDGDIIVLATDGLFDNMSDNMILNHLRIIKVQCKRGSTYLLAC